MAAGPPHTATSSLSDGRCFRHERCGFDTRPTVEDGLVPEELHRGGRALPQPQHRGALHPPAKGESHLHTGLTAQSTLRILLVSLTEGSFHLKSHEANWSA